MARVGGLCPFCIVPVEEDADDHFGINPPYEEEIIAVTKLWLERAVIGLNLCPFAKSVHVKNQIRYVVSKAQTLEELLREFLITNWKFWQSRLPRR